MIIDFFRIAIENLTRRKTRAFLTILSIVISVGSLVALLLITQGLMNSIDNIFEQMGRDKIYISQSSIMASSFVPSSVFSSNEFTKSELSKIRKIDGIIAASPVAYDKALVTFDDEPELVFVSGLPTGKEEQVIKEMQQLEITQGKDFEKNDIYKAILGCRYAKGEVFDKKVELGDKITLVGKEFKVIGFLGCKGNKQDDSAIIIPIKAYQEITNKTTYNAIIAKADDSYNVTKVAEAVKTELRRLRNLRAGEENFEVQTSEDIIETFNHMMSILQLLIIALSLVSLIVAGFVIMNSMYTSVLERKREIGIFKAIGAKNSDVALLFIIETIVLSIFGGVIGLCGGFTIGKLVEYFANSCLGSELLIVTLDLRLTGFALAFSLALGLFSTAYPALKAAKLNPVEAIRS